MNFKYLIFWICLAVGLCLMPGPDWWLQQERPAAGELTRSEVGLQVLESQSRKQKVSRPIGPAVKTFLNDNRKVKERLGHFVPMVGIGFCLMRMLCMRGQRKIVSVLFILVCAGALSLLIEVAQELLPDGFRRGFAWDDIGVAVIGASAGAFSTTIRLKTNSLSLKCGATDFD